MSNYRDGSAFERKMERALEAVKRVLDTSRTAVVSIRVNSSSFSSYSFL